MFNKKLDKTIDDILVKHEINDDNLKSAIKEITQAISKDEEFTQNIKRSIDKYADDHFIG